MKRLLKILYEISVPLLIIVVIAFSVVSVERWINEKPPLLSSIPEKGETSSIIEPKKLKPFVDEQDSRLIGSALSRAQCIDSGDCEWSHKGSFETIRRFVKYRRAGEVLARDFMTWEDVMAAWDKSATHKAVIEDKWCIYGMARVNDTYVMHFACE